MRHSPDVFGTWGGCGIGVAMRVPIGCGLRMLTPATSKSMRRKRWVSKKGLGAARCCSWLTATSQTHPRSQRGRKGGHQWPSLCPQIKKKLTKQPRHRGLRLGQRAPSTSAPCRAQRATHVREREARASKRTTAERLGGWDQRHFVKVQRLGWIPCQKQMARPTTLPKSLAVNGTPA